MSGQRQRAFTLIEVLVALAVFGVLSVMAYMALGQTLSNADLLTERMERLQAVQRTIRYLDADLMQAVPRPVRDVLGEGYQPAIRTNIASEFAAGGNARRLAEPGRPAAWHASTQRLSHRGR